MPATNFLEYAQTISDLLDRMLAAGTYADQIQADGFAADAGSAVKVAKGSIASV
jgi:hypothetical protein